MIRSLKALLTVGMLAMMLLTSVAAAHAAGPASGIPGAPCSSTSSAINQYCENLPSATGGGPPPAGSPGAAPSGSTGAGSAGTSGVAPAVLGNALSPAAARAFQRLPVNAQERARKLLSLPAPAAPVPVTGSIAVPKSGWSLPIGVLLAVVAIAAAGILVAIARRRRRTE